MRDLNKKFAATRIMRKLAVGKQCEGDLWMNGEMRAMKNEENLSTIIDSTYLNFMTCTGCIIRYKALFKYYVIIWRGWDKY